MQAARADAEAGAVKPEVQAHAGRDAEGAAEAKANGAKSSENKPDPASSWPFGGEGHVYPRYGASRAGRLYVRLKTLKRSLTAQAA